MGRPKVMDGLPDSLQRSIDEWILSHARHSASRIFRRFNLVERKISPRTFRRYVAALREEHKPGEGTDSAATDYENADDLLVDLFTERAETGDAKHFAGMAAMLRALSDRRRLKFDELAAQRATEKHEAWKEQERKRLASEKKEADHKLDALAVENGIPDKVRDAVKSLYGITI